MPFRVISRDLARPRTISRDLAPQVLLTIAASFGLGAALGRPPGLVEPRGAAEISRDAPRL